MRRLAAQRPPHVDALPAAAPLVAARAARRRGQLRGATSAGTAAPARAARALSKLRPASRSSSLASASGTSTSAPSESSPSAPGGSGASSSRTRRARPRRPATSCGRAPGRSSAGGGPSAASSGLECLSPSRSPKIAKKTASKARDLAGIGHQDGTRRPVQPPPADRPDERERAREVGRARGRDRDARVVQPPAQRAGQRRQVELDRLDPEGLVGDAGVSHRCARAPRGRPRGRRPGPRRTSAPSRACGRPPRRPAAPRRAG